MLARKVLNNKIHIIKKIFYLNEKNMLKYGKIISYWIQTYFDWIKIWNHDIWMIDNKKLT